MYERKNQKLIPRYHFIKRLLINIFIGLLITFISLFGGMIGYRHYEGMNWVDAYVNASMILSGMGPVQELKTEAGKIFAGSYALFSGIIFLVTASIISIPLFHRFFHQFHIEED